MPEGSIIDMPEARRWLVQELIAAGIRKETRGRRIRDLLGEAQLDSAVFRIRQRSGWALPVRTLRRRGARLENKAHRQSKNFLIDDPLVRAERRRARCTGCSAHALWIPVVV